MTSYSVWRHWKSERLNLKGLVHPKMKISVILISIRMSILILIRMLMESTVNSIAAFYYTTDIDGDLFKIHQEIQHNSRLRSLKLIS